MNWDEVWKIALAIVASMGGIGAIVMGVIKFGGDKIAERLAKRYEHELAKKMEFFKNELAQEMEAFKSGLGRKDHISKTRFDTEFQVYRELSSAFFQMNRHLAGLMVLDFARIVGEADSKEEADEEIDEAVKQVEAAAKAVNVAQETLFQNAPFIPEKSYADFLAVLELGVEQFNDWEKKDHKRGEKIYDKLVVLSGNIRNYLKSLDVIEA